MTRQVTTQTTVAYQFDMTTEQGRKAAYQAGEYRGQQDALMELDNPCRFYQQAYNNGWDVARNFIKQSAFFGQNFTNDKDAFCDRYAESYAAEYMTEIRIQFGTMIEA